MRVLLYRMIPYLFILFLIFSVFFYCGWTLSCGWTRAGSFRGRVWGESDSFLFFIFSPSSCLLFVLLFLYSLYDINIQAGRVLCVCCYDSGGWFITILLGVFLFIPYLLFFLSLHSLYYVCVGVLCVYCCLL